MTLEKRPDGQYIYHCRGRKVFLIKHRTKYTGAPISGFYFPKELIGKRIRIIVEVVDDDMS